MAVALAVILIVKANKNRFSYGNTIELDFLLTGLNSLLKNVVNNGCLRPFHVRTCECICLWLYFQSVRRRVQWFCVMAFEWCNAAPWPWCNCNHQMMTLNQGKLCFCAMKSLFMTDDLPKYCDLAPRRIRSRLVCRWNCYDRCFGARRIWSRLVCRWTCYDRCFGA